MTPAEIQIQFLNAAASGDLKTVAIMIAAKIIPSSNVLYYAVLNKRVQVARRLLEGHQFTAAALGRSLCAALETKQDSLALRLIQEGADPNATQGLLRRPALLLAIENGFTEIAEELLKRKADPNSHDIPVGATLLGTPVGKTALMTAAAKGNVGMVKRLLIAGANPALKGSDGRVASDNVPKSKKGAEVASVLKEWRIEDRPKERDQHLSLSTGLGKPPASWTGALAWLEQHIEAPRTTKARHETLVMFPLRLEVAQSLAGHKPMKADQHEGLEAYLAGLERVKQVMAEVRASWFLQFTVEDGALLCGVPIADKWKVLALFTTACANYGVSHSALVKFLRSLEKEHSFELVECDETSVGGCFNGKLKDPQKIARMLFSFCPFVAESDGGDLKRFAKSLERSRHFKIWWD